MYVSEVCVCVYESVLGGTDRSKSFAAMNGFNGVGDRSICTRFASCRSETNERV